MLSMAQCHKHQLRLLLHNDYKLKKELLLLFTIGAAGIQWLRQWTFTQ